MNELFSLPTAGFDHPLEMLVACHVRVRRNCRLIERIAEHLEDEGVDEEVIVASASALRYFDVAGRDHHRDEEEDLFPALLAAASASDRPGVESLVSRLRDDHVRLEKLWSEVRALLETVAAGRSAKFPPVLAAALSRAYDDHITEEEGVLLPLARRMLPVETLERVGASMARRRGVK
ncbi:hypothetical protein BWI17_21725 [Betaproteobacteria bacterium GR16-43]|nr:hypothetical protein BWI17_21725 [Betaproteobacteria bacterium GR16-43]